jgi:hypothetical protein
MSPSAIASKMFQIWRSALDKLDTSEKVILELAIQEGNIIKAIDKWLEVEARVHDGEITPEGRLKALFGDKVTDIMETVLFQEKAEGKDEH